MKIVIIGSKEADSLEWNLNEAFNFRGEECSILDVLDRPLAKSKYGNQIDFLLRRYSNNYDEKLFKRFALKACKEEPELIICTYRFINPIFVKIIKQKLDCKIIHVNPDQLTTFEYQQIFASDYDAFFTKDPYIAKFMRNNMKLNAILYNEAFNIRTHKRPNIPKDIAEKNINIDVVTYGTIYPYRARMLKQVVAKDIQLKIYGVKPHRFYDKSLDPYFQNKYITGEKKAKILYGSKIVFNQMHYAEIESVNNRFFEAYGAGAFQLSDYRKILSRILPKEVKPELVSFNGIDDGIDKIKYYLRHSRERYEIANTIYQYFIQHYTYDNLVDYILNSI